MITLPLALAALTAGLVGGVHCIGMCGGISTLLSQAPEQKTTLAKSVIVIRAVEQKKAAQENISVSNIRHELFLHGGRLLTYMLIGMFFGSIGAAGMQFKPYFPVQSVLFVAGNLALVLLGLRILGLTPNLSIVRKISGAMQRAIYSLMPAIERGKRHPFLLGMSWGCLPCGLLYAVVPFAFFSGNAVSGAVVMLLFGVAALPHLLLTQSALRHLNRGRFARHIQTIAASCLILIGLFGLWYFDMKNMPGFLCVTPA
jgi:sulfite exporter TauE/SafE